MYRGAHSVLEHRLGATSVAAFITKRAALVRSQVGSLVFCGRRLGGGAGLSEDRSLGWLLGASCVRWWIWTSENPVPANFGERRYGEVRRIPLLGTWLNKAHSGRIEPPAPAINTVALDAICLHTSGHFCLHP
jgi:hypothetical protein